MASPSLDADSAVMPDSIDADTCRICRGEGSPEEPLFYPCKCSGSIKFVHQDCLMEWLSHSQKKYCELCKTPFRFTKLYHPHMPRRLPTTVFLRKAALHLLSKVMLWCRALLVLFVWLILLPWTMRGVWRFLFWFIDSGYARTAEMENDWPDFLANTYPTNYSEPKSSSILPSPERWRQSNISQPLVYRMMKTFFLGATHSSTRELHFAMTANSTFNSTTHNLIRQKYSSILSEVRFFRGFTSSVAFNRSVMDVVEGLIITLSVVVAFILVFLIREWVIQQQPLVNGDADANNRDLQAHLQPPEEPNQQEPQDPANEAHHDTGDEAHDEPHDLETDDDSDFTDETDQSELDSSEDAPTPPSPTLGGLSDSSGSHATHPISAEDISAATVNGSSSVRHRAVQEENSSSKSNEPSRSPDPSHNRTRHTITVRPVPLEAPEARNVAITPNEEARTTRDTELSNDENEEKTAHTRPDRPLRGNSFVADEILKGLGERGHENTSRSSSLRHSDNSADQRSSPVVTVNHETVEQPDKALGKGKERLIDDKLDSEEDMGSNTGDAADPVSYIVGEMRYAQWKALAEIEAENGHPINHVSKIEGPSVPLKNSDVEGPTSQTADSTESSATQAEGSFTVTNTNPPIGENQNTPIIAGQHQSWIAYLYDWFWGDIVPPREDDGEERGNDEHVVNDIAEEEPFVPFADAQPVFQEQNPPPPAENVANEANNLDAEEPNDRDGAEDVEDLEGILELVGMQGPIIGLFQNAIFSALLISATIMGTVLVPYWLGKIELLFLGNPSMMWQAPFGMLSGMADLIADMLLFLGGFAAYFLTKLINVFVFWGNVTHDPSRSLAARAGTRLSETTIALLNSDPSASLAFSMIAHSSLIKIKANILLAFRYVVLALSSVNATSAGMLTRSEIQNFMQSTLPTWFAKNVAANTTAMISTLKTLLKTGKIHVTISHSFDIDDVLAYWSARDKTTAVLVGYACVAGFAAFYVGYLAPLTTSPQSKRVELAFVEVIKQAGGVCKVIFIISIEMIAFPLFCGFLLDLALLPLFENASITSRLSFTYSSPWTSGFVHWFVGTCYMFHFALFVSMCRKIMRGGVLYFIRDPDDPTFHPVRDVLERSVTVQLRKIAFSAIVYGTLIVVCLGGVVWGLRLASDSILPIHWTSSESEREFPLDILFFNFLTPVVVRLTKPTDGLHAMYQWWFQRCARSLRLSHFLFGQEHLDEQGQRVDGSWKDWALESTGLARWFPSPSTISTKEGEEVASTTEPSFEFEGRYARVPASDQIRIPKGNPVFLDVDKEDNRLDGKAEEPAGTHGKDSRLVTKVYIPPFFKTRISLFVLAVWMFAAATGVSVTIVPLLFGRWLLSSWVPSAGRVNDIYAFSLGIYLLGAAIYTAVHFQTIISFTQTHLLRHARFRTETVISVGRFIKRSASIFYVYTSFAIGLPILMTIILELYILLPLHTYLGRTETHIVHLVQDWTLGILYLRIFSHIILAAPLSIPARIVSAITANGYLAPNARTATRALILPSVLTFAVLTLVPYTLAQLANRTVFAQLDHAQKVLVLRLAYPAALGAISWFWFSIVFARSVARWRQRIKDEVYLIGERLHNFGEKRFPRHPLNNNPAPAAVVSEGPVPQDAAAVEAL